MALHQLFIGLIVPAPAHFLTRPSFTAKPFPMAILRLILFVPQEVEFRKLAGTRAKLVMAARPCIVPARQTPFRGYG